MPQYADSCSVKNNCPYCSCNNSFILYWFNNDTFFRTARYLCYSPIVDSQDNYEYQYPPYKKDKNTEEKVKVVTAAWETEFIQFLAALAI